MPRTFYCSLISTVPNNQQKSMHKQQHYQLFEKGIGRGEVPISLPLRSNFYLLSCTHYATKERRSQNFKFLGPVFSAGRWWVSWSVCQDVVLYVQGVPKVNENPWRGDRPAHDRSEYPHMTIVKNRFEILPLL